MAGYMRDVGGTRLDTIPVARAEMEQEAVFTRFLEGSIATSTAQPVAIMVAPWPCRLLAATLTIPDTTNGDIGPGSTDRWEFRLRRYRASAALPVPVAAANGTLAGDISSKSTATNGIRPRFAFRLTQQLPDPTNAVFRAGEMLGVIATKTGAPASLIAPIFQARVERI